MDVSALEEGLRALPLYLYAELDPEQIEFTQRVRHVCTADCPMFGSSYACPPAVGTVEQCREKCLSYRRCLLIATLSEVEDIASMDQTLATRAPHEEITDQVVQLLHSLGQEPYTLSTESCARCSRCAYLDGLPCRFPDKMHPCVESHGINILPTLERLGIGFQYGENVVTWVSLLFYDQKDRS